MKNSLAIAVGTVVLLAAGMPLAQNTKAPVSTPMQSGSPMKMGSSMGQMDNMPQMDEHMQKMKALHEMMASAATPEARQKLMDEQRQEMQAGMGMMNQMMQAGGMTGSKGGGMMAPKGKATDANSQMQMMQKRMDMMQTMMQAMMDQQGMMTGHSSRDAAAK